MRVTRGWGPRVLPGVVLLLVVALLGGANAPAHAGTEPLPTIASAAGVAADEPSDYVVVRYASAVRAQAAGDADTPPILADDGYVRLPVPEGKSAEEFVAELEADPGVIFAIEDARVYAQAIPDDTFYLTHQALYFSQIGAPQGWDIMTDSPSVVVAVIDSGVDVRHPDLAGQLWENPAETESNGIDDDGNGCIDDRYGCRFVQPSAACGYASSTPVGAILDDHGQSEFVPNSHGTLVAGILGATGNNFEGISGASWNVKIMSVKVLDCGPFGRRPSGYMSDVAAGIRYAVRMGADIINLSLATDPRVPGADSPLMREAIEEAESRGVIVVAAAGNYDLAGVGYPAAYTEYSNVVAVGAATSANTWAPYSSVGPAVDLAAPGNLIVGTSRTDLGPAIYGIAEEGTSYAAPLVSGMFALLKARNPALPVSRYIEIAMATATPAPEAPHGENWAGAGIVHFGRALARVPATFSGNALHDWKDVPAGTPVVASVEGTTCASTLSFTVGPAGRYLVQVPADPEQPGCGAPGRTVAFSIGGLPAQPTFTWGGRNVSLAYINRDISSVTPGPGPVVEQTLNGRWSNIAYLNATGPLPDALEELLPEPWDAVLRWDPLRQWFENTGAYERYYRSAPGYVNQVETLHRYEAFWTDAAAGTVASANPEPAPGRTVQLQPGWNNFVWTGPPREVRAALASIEGKYLHLLHFDNATETWLSYIPGQLRYLQDFNGLFQFRVYWIYVTEPVQITM